MRLRGIEIDATPQLKAALSRLPRGSGLSGFSAAWLLGMDVAPCDPIEATVPDDAGVSGRVGMKIRRSNLPPCDLIEVRGIPLTSAVRTIAELCSRLNLIEAVVIADEALHKRLVTLDQLTAWAVANPRRRGIRMLRRVLRYAEPASESQMETRLRMVLEIGRLPRPRAQVPIFDASGRFVGRPDLYYERQRLGIEYDGGIHRDALAEDDRRQNRLLTAGVRLLRFTASDVLGNPGFVVAQVRGMLATAGRSVVESPGTRASAGSRR